MKLKPVLALEQDGCEWTAPNRDGTFEPIWSSEKNIVIII